MDKLSIDTSSSEEIVVALGKKIYRSLSRKRASQELLPLIDKILKENKISLSEINEIKVNTGPGSFTGLRVGVSVANALSWTLGIPINANKTSSVDIKYS